MSTPNYDQSKLASIKTYMLIAFIFNIIGYDCFRARRIIGNYWLGHFFRLLRLFGYYSLAMPRDY